MGIKVNPNDVIFSLDIGTRSIIGTVGVVKDRKFKVLYESYIEHQERAMVDGQIHDIALVADAVNIVKGQLEKKLKFKLQRVAIAAAGRFLRTSIVMSELKIDQGKEIDKELIRSLELTAVKKAEDETNKDTQGRLYCVGYSVKSYFLNGYVINNLLAHKGDSIGVEVIATFLPRSVVESLYAVMGRVGLEVNSLTLEPIAAIEAVIPPNLRLLNLALIDIGAGTSDIAISSKESIVAYGMVPLAGDEVTEAIAQYYLVDFNTAERIKREASTNDVMSYTDVLGIYNEITREELMKVISSTVKKISDEIGNRIIELNGGKSPNALFLVGGGAHTPMLRELLAEKLNLQLQRIAIKGREAVEDCVNQDNGLGSTGVTVLGIALVCLRRLGQDFINVTFNGDVISLFNFNKHTVMDVLVQAGVNPKSLIGKNGRNIKFTLNGLKRIAFGAPAENAIIKVNDNAASIDNVLKEGDIIEVIYAKDGKSATPKILDYASGYVCKSFYYNNEICNIEPIASINGEKVPLDNIIEENDEVEITYPVTFGEFIKYYIGMVDADSKFYIGNKEIGYNYIIEEGDNITIQETDKGSRAFYDKDEEKAEDVFAGIIIKLKVNSEEILLEGKDKYIFIDIFNHVKFDLTRPNGNLVLKLNGNNAGYYDELKSGDEIEIYWN